MGTYAAQQAAEAWLAAVGEPGCDARGAAAKPQDPSRQYCMTLAEISRLSTAHFFLANRDALRTFIQTMQCGQA